MADTTVEEFSELLDAVSDTEEDTAVDSPTQGDPKEPPKAEKPKGKPGRKPKADSTPPAAPAQEAPKASKFFVAKGKSISTKSRGIVDSGKEVFSADFSEGDQRLEELTTAGYLTKS